MKFTFLSAAALTAALALPAGMATARAHAATMPAVSGLSGAGYVQERPWDQPPDEYRDVQRQGFHDGVEAARRDWDHHAHKDADDHERYRHPPVARDMHDDYRSGFREGYSRAMHHMQEEHHDDHPY